MAGGALATFGCSLFIATDGLTGAPLVDSDGGADTSDAGEREASVTSSDAGVDDASDGGRVAPTDEILVSGQSGVFALARSATTLYWTTRSPSGSVRACALPTCESPTVIANGGSPYAIAWLGRALWIDDTSPVLSYTGDDGGVGNLQLDRPSSWIAVGDTYNYLVANDGAPLKLLYSQDAPPATTTSYVPFSALAERLCAAAGATAWTSPEQQSVSFCPDQGCTEMSSIVVQGDSAIAITMNGSRLFWTTSDGRIRFVERNATAVTSTPADLATGLPEPAGLVLEDFGPMLYFSARGTSAASYLDGVIGKVPQGGGPVTILAEHQARPEGLVVTSTHVYWANAYDGTIHRAAK